MNPLDPKTFFFELPPYTPIQIEAASERALVLLLQFRDRIDAYNPIIKEQTTYSSNHSILGSDAYNFIKYGGYGYLSLKCVRTDELFHFCLYYDSNKKIFMKIGQFPSIADLHIGNIKEYASVLSREKIKEFTRAIGIAANGVGIGSFVYLRRIFEDLIEEAHIIAKENSSWNEQDFKKSRMDDKINLLKNFLPEFLIENKGMYGILSVGIHELTEEQCLTHFETVKVGIELILDEKLEKFRKTKKIEDAKNKLTNVTTKLKESK
ncbi:MAG: short-chain dehydrogenase [Bacteroidia bacterium]|nr:short-chain dehydrogenase [Bacteroidia bacterium]